MQQIAYFGARCGGFGAPYGRARAHDQVNPCECAALGAKYFARDAFTVIARYGARHHTFADYDAETRAGNPVGSGIHLEQPAVDPAFISEHRGERIGTVEPVRPGKRVDLARPGQTPRRARPLARRARTTARPPRVFMRTRNPCVRLRRVVDGW